MLHFIRRFFALVFLAYCAIFVVSQAQTFPSKTITIIVPTAPGGANDAMARIIAQSMSPHLGQAVMLKTKLAQMVRLHPNLSLEQLQTVTPSCLATLQRMGSIQPCKS